MTPTQRILHLAAAAPTRPGEALALLREASELYHQGLQDAHQRTAERLGALVTTGLVLAEDTGAGDCGQAQDRAEMILLVALAEWEMTPAAIAYSQMAESAARRGICLVPAG
ncbi:hypothetical protein [Streptomyces formicae]